MVEEKIHDMQRELQELGYDGDDIGLLGRAIANTGMPLDDVVGGD